jgi:hypothetical protein
MENRTILIRYQRLNNNIKINKKRWLRLSYMIIDILSIPIMSDKSERIFLGARRTISWEKAQMKTENLEKMECLNYWKRNDISDEILEIVD